MINFFDSKNQRPSSPDDNPIFTPIPDTFYLAYIPVLHRGWLNFLEDSEKQVDRLAQILEKENFTLRASTRILEAQGGDTQDFFKFLGESRLEPIVLVPAEKLLPWAPTHKDLQALPVEDMVPLLKTLYPQRTIGVITNTAIKRYLNREGSKIIIPDDYALKSYVEQKMPKAQIIVRNCWLRWEKQKIVEQEEIEQAENERLRTETSRAKKGRSKQKRTELNWAKTTSAQKKILAQTTPDAEVNYAPQGKKYLQPVEADGQIDNFPTAEIDAALYDQLFIEGEKSGDFWRQVGAIAVKDDLVLLATHNTHLPHPDQPYREGDMRAQFHKGDHIEATTAIHAEALLVATASKKGLSLENADLYLTDFPCPTCAKLISQAGFRNLFFARGYSLLDGKRVLEAGGVKIYQISNQLAY